MSAKTKGDLVIAGEPRVQLLPPTVRAREKAREARSLAVLLTILAVALVGAGITFAYFQLITVQQQLAQAQSDQAALLAKQLELTEGSKAAAGVEMAKAAIIYGSSTEVRWAQFISDEVVPALPEAATLAVGSMHVHAPWEGLYAPTGVQRLPGDVTMNFGVHSERILPATVFYDDARARLTEKGLIDAYIVSSTWDEEKEYFNTVIELTFDSRIFWGRFSAEQLDALITSGEFAEYLPAAIPGIPAGTPDETEGDTPETTGDGTSGDADADDAAADDTEGAEG